MNVERKLLVHKLVISVVYSIVGCDAQRSETIVTTTLGKSGSLGFCITTLHGNQARGHGLLLFVAITFEHGTFHPSDNRTVENECKT
jgi:hypothetical protein